MIFVFGSNLAGRHGKGAALYALQHHGAVYGQGQGRQGNSYAIPTKDAALNPLKLELIAKYVDNFLFYAFDHLHEYFQITPIGTGLAGYTHEQIAPMFINRTYNCLLPPEWQPIIEELDAQTKERRSPECQ